MGIHLQHLPPEWQRPVGRLRGWIAFGWFLQGLIPWGIVGIGLGSLLHWIFRSLEQNVAPAWGCLGGLLLVGSLRAVEACQRHQLSASMLLSRLDDSWCLDQKLVRAASLSGDWPDVPEPRPPFPLQFRWQAWMPWLALSVGLVGMAVWMPLPVQEATEAFSRFAPPDWQTMEGVIEELKEKEIVEPRALEELQEDVERLQAIPEQEWYGPASLEATDRMKERIQSESLKLAEGMRRTAEILQIADTQGHRLPAPQQTALQERLQDMLKQLGENGLPLQADQLEALRQIDLSQMQQISEAELQQLQQQLREQGKALEEALLMAGLLGEGDAAGSRWGTDGGGPADLGIGAKETTAFPVVPVLLEMKKPETARLGDQLELREIEHQDSSAETNQSAGGVASPGGAGSATWQEDLLPAEQQVLKQFFQSNSTQIPATDSP